MAEYNHSAERVKEYMHIYGRMIYLHNELSAGVLAERSRQAVQKCIDNAKTKVPEELKDERFNYILSGLEKIVEGQPYNS